MQEEQAQEEAEEEIEQTPPGTATEPEVAQPPRQVDPKKDLDGKAPEQQPPTHSPVQPEQTPPEVAIEPEATPVQIQQEEVILISSDDEPDAPSRTPTPTPATETKGSSTEEERMYSPASPTYSRPHSPESDSSEWSSEFNENAEPWVQNLEGRCGMDLEEAKKYLSNEEFIWYVTSVRKRWSKRYTYTEQAQERTIARTEALYKKVEEGRNHEYNMEASTSRAGTTPKYRENPNRGETTDCRAPPGFHEKPNRTQKPPRQALSDHDANLLRGIAITKEEAEKKDPATHTKALQCGALLCDKLKWHSEALSYWRELFHLSDSETQNIIQKEITALESQGDCGIDEVTCWNELGLEPGATRTEINNAFKKRAWETHPDKAEPGAERFQNYRFKRAGRARDLCIKYHEQSSDEE